MRHAPAGDDARRRARILGLILTVVVLVAAAIFTLTFTASRGDVVGPSSADQDGGLGVNAMNTSASASNGVVAAPPTLRIDLFTDYTDPDSARFASVNALVIQGLAQQGVVEIAVHPVAIGADGPARDASIRAGNAVACVGEHAPKDLWAFHVGLLAMQPSGDLSALQAPELIAVARDSGVHAIEEVSACISQASFADWIERESDDALDAGIGAHGIVLDRMPLVLANGVAYEGRIDSSDEFRTFLDAQLAGS